jgi:hypothetical protein
MSATSPVSSKSRDSVEEAAMPTDEAALAQLRQANAHLAADYKRRLAAIDRRLKALEDRALVDEILSVTLGEPES